MNQVHFLKVTFKSQLKPPSQGPHQPYGHPGNKAYLVLNQNSVLINMVQGICLRPMERYDVNEDYRINIATVDEGGESDCDAVPQLLLVSKSNLSISATCDSCQ